RKERRQDDDPVLLGEVGEGVAVGLHSALRAVDNDGERIAVAPVLIVAIGHVGAVAEALIEPAGINRGPTEIVIGKMLAVPFRPSHANLRSLHPSRCAQCDTVSGFTKALYNDERLSGNRTGYGTIYNM